MAYEALYTRGRPKIFAQLIGQEHIVNSLTRAVSSNKLSHAYLLVGTRGTGKTSTARLLAKAMNCEKVLSAQNEGRALTAAEIPCNKCPSCLSIDSSPDNVEFDAASNRSVEDVTRLLSTAYLAPMQSRVKTFIIDEIHMLSNEAINSILKLIEEPPPNVAFFLATTELNKVPMTIRSRCQVLNFRLIPQEIISPYLLRLANRLGVELEVSAAQRIARLAEGSMRDAMTYLDQCYAMADKKISLDTVNETLGLISDADLDEIISAVQSQDRAKVAAAVTHAFSSGLSAVVIAESLITRLRDLEFDGLSKRSYSGVQNLDNFVEAVRRAILEMQNSGIPDVILEMTLLKLAAPQIISTQQIISAPQKISAPVQTPTANLREVPTQNISDADNILDTLPKSLSYLKNHATVKDFSGNTLTLSMTQTGIAVFSDGARKQFEEHLEKKFNRKITVKTVPAENSDAPNLNSSFLKKTLEAFETTKYEKISEE